MCCWWPFRLPGRSSGSRARYSSEEETEEKPATLRDALKMDDGPIRVGRKKNRKKPEEEPPAVPAGGYPK